MKDIKQFILESDSNKDLPECVKQFQEKYKLKLGNANEEKFFFNSCTKKLRDDVEGLFEIYGFDSSDKDKINAQKELNNKLTKDILKDNKDYKLTVTGVWQRASKGRWRGDFYGEPWADLNINIYDKNADSETGFNDLARINIEAGKGNHSYVSISLNYKNKKDDINKYVEYLVNAFNYIVDNK